MVREPSGSACLSSSPDSSLSMSSTASVSIVEEETYAHDVPLIAMVTKMRSFQRGTIGPGPSLAAQIVLDVLDDAYEYVTIA